jgi:UDP-2,3-diacylglucosamine hydrolase
MTTLFISDLHLDPARPDITTQFLTLLAGEAREAEALYVLGDLFEAWIGDDDPEPDRHRVTESIRRLGDDGVPCFFMAGNRDFLTGEVFRSRTGFRVLHDPTVIDLYGRRVLIMHGDTLCTDDVQYQRFRRMVRDPAWQQHFLSQTVAHRAAMVSQARDASRAHTDRLPAAIMDVNKGAVDEAMRAHDVDCLVHGHTHRPAVHTFVLDGRPASRIVLGDWHHQGSVLRWHDRDRFELVSLPR